jgi:hypothetical protein
MPFGVGASRPRSVVLARCSERPGDGCRTDALHPVNAALAARHPTRGCAPIGRSDWSRDREVHALSAPWQGGCGTPNTDPSGNDNVPVDSGADRGGYVARRSCRPLAEWGANYGGAATRSESWKAMGLKWQRSAFACASRSATLWSTRLPVQRWVRDDKCSADRGLAGPAVGRINANV